MCMHSTPQKPLGFSNGNNQGNLIYGVEYENTGVLSKNVNGDAACVVCQHLTVTNVYVQWGRTSCSNNHHTEYSGLIMSTYYKQHKSQNICVDLERAVHKTSSNANNDGGMLYVTEMEGGSTDEALYPHDREVACAVCAPLLGQGMVCDSLAGKDHIVDSNKCGYTGDKWVTTVKKGCKNFNDVYMAGKDTQQKDVSACQAKCLATAGCKEISWGRVGGGADKRCQLFKGHCELTDNDSLDSIKYVQAVKSGAKCTFTCAPGFKQTGAGTFTCDSTIGKWVGGVISCKATQKCSKYTCGSGVLKGNADSIVGADDETCCDVIDSAVFTRWGSRECPEGTTMLYDGFMASSYANHNGGGYNAMCMHPKAQFPEGYSNGNQQGNLIYGMEYMNTGVLDKNHAGDAACAVCQHKTASTVYVQWGRTSCSNGHNTEYTGLVMANHYTQQKSENICVDLEREVHPGNNGGNTGGGYLYTSEMEGGSSDEKLYPSNREVACAVCSPKEHVAVFSRWGRRTCPEKTNMVYEGFMASAYGNHNGGGANPICMHSLPQYPVGYSDGSQQGNLLYGMEYMITGAIDNLRYADASCVVCQAETARTTYVQWGRTSCSNGHNTMYSGLVMSTRYTEREQGTMCIDKDFVEHPTSHPGHNGGGYLYTTEMEGGSSDEKLYPHNREVACALCAPAKRTVVYTRWGSRSCPDSSIKLYEGFIANSYYSHKHHNGGGINALCMHNSPQYPRGYNDGDQNGNLLYGTEYENTGALDKNHNGDAACAVCEHKTSTTVYTQWGRTSCSNGHNLEYTGYLMSTHYGQNKAENICVDKERAVHAANSNGDQNGSLLYTSEMEGGSADEGEYRVNVEIACSVCSPPFSTLAL